MRAMVAPKSPTGIVTGLCGLIVGVAAVYSGYGWEQPDYVKTTIVLGLAALAMVVADLIVYRPYLRESTGLAPGRVNSLSVSRIVQKLIGFWATIGIIAAGYWALPEYAREFYLPFKEAFVLVLPVLVAASPLYIIFVDRRQLEPVDAYVELARLLGGTLPADWATLAGHARAWAVKAFFLPLMFVFCNNYLRDIWASPLVPEVPDFGSFYEFAYSGFFLIDVLVATIGYSLTFRILDAHIRSAEPTTLGWVVCVICYPPFWDSISGSYFAYERDEMYWGHVFMGWPVLYIIWGTVILALVAVYTWATLSFGTRFSNLTHRGIITNGPYRWMKHPAYVTKNLSWWMISVPFLTSGDWMLAVQASLLLLGVNAIYFLRARTEERHLARDPVYREYQAFIAQHGLWAVLRRRLSARPSPAEVGAGFQELNK
jgi:uncharacterized membrane protein